MQKLVATKIASGTEEIGIDEGPILQALQALSDGKGSLRAYSSYIKSIFVSRKSQTVYRL